MKIKIFQFVSLIALVFGSAMLSAQSGSITITGKIVEANSKLPIEFATVLIADTKTDKTLEGTTTDATGRFSLHTNAEDFHIKVSFIGFSTKTIKDIKPVKGELNLNTIELQEDGEVLDEVVVRAEKSQTQFKLDKRVFNVGKDLSSTGASALEVLNNVPSVNVNIEGQISLRGSQGVQMLINGKPSVLASEEGNALGTITADMIDRVEVITNPSAKYDAEGTAGIINIVLKKEEKKGLNGSITINTGVPNNHSLGLSLNKRTEKFNLFSQLGIGRRTFPGTNESVSRDLLNNTVLETVGESEKNETFYNVILGTDYHINKLNVVTLSGHFAFEQEDENALTNFSYFDNSESVTSGWSRNELTVATNPKWQYELQYKKDFERHKDQNLLFSALGNFFGKDKSSDFENVTTFGNDPDMTQQSKTNFKEAEYTFKLDYTHPFAEKFTIETGAQYVINDVANDYAVNDFIDDAWVANPNFTNVFEYDQKVLGVYGTGAYEGDKWGVKLGLRLENTDLNTLLVNTNKTNDQNYTNLFPSAHTSYKISEQVSVQAGYSRRIFRPRLWDLNPFFSFRNNFNISTGNPDLLPEYTDSYEITSIYAFGQASINFGVYHRYTTDVVEDVTTFENNVSTRMPINVGTNNATGVEFNAKYSPVKWFSVNGDFNFNYFNRQGAYEGVSFDFDANRWSSKLMAKFKLPADIDMEITGQYRSKYQTFQQEVADNLFADFGIRKKLFKGKAILNLSIRDVFASRRYEYVTNEENFYLSSSRMRGRFISFGVSYGFGKGEAMEFSAQKRH